jgi:hypothetical protein
MRTNMKDRNVLPTIDCLPATETPVLWVESNLEFHLVHYNLRAVAVNKIVRKRHVKYMSIEFVRCPVNSAVNNS